MQVVIGVSDARASADPEDLLVTYSLGSCIGVTLYDAATGIGGLLHYQLPSSSADSARASEKPLMFADTGMRWLVGKMESMGASRRRMQVRLAGAAQMLDDGRIFDIGRRNHTAIRKLLWQNGMFIEAEAIGGTSPRTMRLNIADGMVTIHCNGETFPLDATENKTCRTHACR